MPTIKSKSPGYVAYKINEKTWYAPRGDRAVEWIDPTLAGELNMRTQTLPHVNINHKRQPSPTLHSVYPHVLPAGHTVLPVGVPS